MGHRVGIVGAMDAPFVVLTATGNRFALFDGFMAAPPEDPGALAMVLAERDGLAVDGLLQMLPSEKAAARMVLHNADGSRADACGNGLRCIARLAVERGYVTERAFDVETDTGVRRVELLERGGELALARAGLGKAEVLDLGAKLEVREGVIEVGIVRVGNPHAVLFVPDAETAPVASIGAQVESHSLFPDRTNVEFVDVRGAELIVRIFERGVGETASCGTGCAAAAVVAIERGRVRSPVRVRTRGGTLIVKWDGEEVSLEGEVGPVEATLDLEALL